MAVHTATRNPAVLSYYAMRRTVGVIALALPFALAGGSMLMALAGPRHALPHPLLERSISDYYYTPMRNLLEGSLWAIAAFLVCSRGYEPIDEVMGYVAGAFTLGVAVFPPVNPRLPLYTPLQVEIGFVHSGFAALMFLSLAYFCLFLFRRSSPQARLTRQKRHRNRIYAICGVTMLVCLTGMVSITARALAHSLRPSPWLFWLESVALAAFGVAWLTKGEGLLKDKAHNHNHLS